MSIKIHHLNCGTMCPFCDKLMNNRNGSWSKPGHFVCHCLLIETPETLIMVDTGLGQQDIADPKRRLGGTYQSLFKPKLVMEETALSQVRALGYDPRDVSQIAVTHLDLDHAGGLADFPDAQLNLLKPELQQIQQPGWREKGRFRFPQFDHHPKWVVHEEEQGEDWFGFKGIRAIPRLSTDILLVPLIGHTRGHMGVAVKDGDKWLLHCGDAYYHHSQVTTNPQTPSGSTFFQVVIAAVPNARVENLARLQQLAINHKDEVDLICAHDPVDLERFTANTMS